VIDFGLSKRFLPNESRFMTEGVGTIYTMAPQVLQGVYTYKADLWSVGVIAYMLLSSTKPFWGRSRKQIIDQIMRCKLDFNGHGWEYVSEEAKQFISNLIVLDPKNRANAEQALAMKWLSDAFPLSDRRPDEKTMTDVAHTLVNHADGGELRRLALMLVAHKANTQEVVKLRQVFDQYDTTNDGTITMEEFRKALEEYKYSDEELETFFDKMDLDKNGFIQYTEFLAATLETLGNVEENQLADAFRQLDDDNSGYISFEVRG
jgi:calcium-dependent protein kinase